MNSNWRNRPTTIDYISKSIDYVVGIDESGTSSLKKVLEAKRKGIEVPDSERHFTVTASVISMEHFAEARDMVMALKNKYWHDALFTYGGTEKRVCFHSREIRGRNDAFSPNLIDYNAFITDLSSMMDTIPITLYASHIDKIRHVNQYVYPMSPYDLCMTFVFERIIYNMPHNKSCIVILESRGKKEDKELLDFIKQLIDRGTSYCSASAFEKIKGVYFNPKWCAMRSDKMSYWELELADLCAYPIHKHFAYGRDDPAYQTILPKIKGYPNVSGHGLKSFP